MGKQWKHCQTLFWGLQNHCRWWHSHEIKRCLFLERKVMTNLDSILKGRDITLATKVLLVNAMVFPVVIYGCESRTIKKAEDRIDAFFIVQLSNSCLPSQWCHPTIKSSVIPFSSYLQSFNIGSIGVFSNESVLHIRWPKYWSFSFSISPSKEYSGLFSFRMD